MSLNLLTTLLLCFAAFELLGCGPSANSNQGFEITTYQCQGDAGALPYNVCQSGPHIPIPNISVSGNRTSDDYNSAGDSMSQGTVFDFGFAVDGDPFVYTDKSGIALISNGRAPANWNLEWLMPFCCGTTNYLGQKYYDQTE